MCRHLNFVTLTQRENILNTLASVVEQMDNRNELWFQQDGATFHISNASHQLREMLWETIVFQRCTLIWSPRSPHLSSPEVFYWAYLKEEYKLITRTFRRCEAKLYIKQEVDTISQEVWSLVMNAFVKTLSSKRN